MEWILKIVEGPMTGAEIALVNGTRISFGSADTCDIVVADATLAPTAFQLDIAEDGVTLFKGEDDADGESLAPFMIRTFGTTAFALGPAVGDWEELKKPDPKTTPEAAAESAAEAESNDGRARSPSAPHETPEGNATPDAAWAPRPHDGTGKRHRRLPACCSALAVIAAIVLAAWFFWPQIAEKCPAVEKVRTAIVDKSRTLYTWGKSKVTKPAPVVIPSPTLEEIAKQYGLTLKVHETRHEGTIHYPLPSTNYPLPSTLYQLTGNLKRRTERLAIRALALAADPRVKLDLTDDETLASAADALLFTVTEGAIKVIRAANRSVSLVGKVGSQEQLETVLRALSADVPGLDKVDASQVTVIPGFKFESAKRQADLSPQVDQPPVAIIQSKNRKIKQSNNQTIKQSLPVAGILTKPYACVVLHDGRRCVEGGYLGAARLVKIAPDALTLEIEGKQFEWRP